MSRLGNPRHGGLEVQRAGLLLQARQQTGSMTIVLWWPETPACTGSACRLTALHSVQVSPVHLQGYAWAEDKEHCEEYGRMLQADPSKVSSRAKKRGLPQVSLHPC